VLLAHQTAVSHHQLHEYLCECYPSIWSFADLIVVLLRTRSDAPKRERFLTFVRNDTLGRSNDTVL